jgi:hypothetical protein
METSTVTQSFEKIMFSNLVIFGYYHYQEYSETNRILDNMVKVYSGGSLRASRNKEVYKAFIDTQIDDWPKILEIILKYPFLRIFKSSPCSIVL